jgi:hypothetical protein
VKTTQKIFPRRSNETGMHRAVSRIEQPRDLSTKHFDCKDSLHPTPASFSDTTFGAQLSVALPCEHIEMQLSTLPLNQKPLIE